MAASKSAGGGYQSQPVNFQQPGMFSPSGGSNMGSNYGRSRAEADYRFQQRPEYRRPGPVRPGRPGGFGGGGFQSFPGYTPPSPPSSQPAPSPFQQPARNSFADLYGQPRSTPTGGYNPMQDMYGSFGQVQQPMPGYFDRYNILGGYTPGGGQPAPYQPPAQFNPVYTPRPDPGSGGSSPSAPTAPGSDYQAGLTYSDSTGPTGYYPGPTPGDYQAPPSATIPDNASDYGADVLGRAAEAGVPPEVIVAQDQQQQDPSSNPEVNIGTFDPTAPQGGAPTPPSAQPVATQPVTTGPQQPVQNTGMPGMTAPAPPGGFPSGGFSPGGYYPSSPQNRFGNRGRGFAPILNYSPRRYFRGY